MKLHNRNCHDLQQAIVKFSMNVASGNVLCCTIPQWLEGGNKVNTAKNVEFGNIIHSFPSLLYKKISRPIFDSFKNKIVELKQTFIQKLRTKIFSDCRI